MFKAKRFARTVLSVFAVACALATSGQASADLFVSKTIAMIETPNSGRPCIFIWLDGVSSAGPATPGQPWMAIRQAHPGYREMVAIIMAAKLANRPINVKTLDTLATGCNLVEVDYITFP